MVRLSRQRQYKNRIHICLNFCAFNRLVQLDKLRLQTRAKEEEQALARGGKDPFIVVKNPSASKGGVAETSIKVVHYRVLSTFTTIGST